MTLVVLFGAGLTVLVVIGFLFAGYYLTGEDGRRALAIDLRVFWAAARLMLAGEPLATFDMSRLAAEHGQNPGEWMPWLYPPGYLLLIAPLGAMSFANAYLATTVVSLGLIFVAVRPFAAGSWQIKLALTLAPAYLPTLFLGQNALLWLAGLLAALAALRAERWVLAGFFIGLLTLKPQLGLLIPIALLASGLWTTILVATLTTAVLALAPTLVFGLEYWPLLADGLRAQGRWVAGSIDQIKFMIGPFRLATQLGASNEAALYLQYSITAASALAVFFIWRSNRIGFDTKVAGLLTAILLSAPYLWYYEAAMMAPIALFLLRSGCLPQGRPGRLILLLLWLGGSLQFMNVFDSPKMAWIFSGLLVTPTLCLCLAFCLTQVVYPRSATQEAT